MNTAEAIFTIIGITVGLLSAGAGLVWWAYKQGQDTGKDKAKIEALERDLLEIRAAVATQQQKRRWWPWRWLLG